MLRRFVLARGLAALLALTAAVGVVAVPAAERAHAFTTITDTSAGPSAARIGLIGDSSFAGVRWLNSYEPLRRFNFVLDAESCRRTIAASCRGREGYAPANALATLRRLEGTFDDVLVMVTGYNDPGTAFGDAVDRIMAEAIRQGIDHVVWLTMRTAAVTYVSPGYRSNATTFRDNNRILLQKADLYNGRLQIADWATYSTPPQGWITPDGVHLTQSGTVAVTDFIADQVELVLAGRRITPPFTAPARCRVGIGLRQGDHLNDVRCLELYLRERGLFAGTPDKDFDAATARAVDQVNVLQGWSRDGIADTGVLQTIGAWRAPTTRPFCTIPRSLQLGSSGTDVSCLIRRLAAHGYHLNNQLHFTQSVHEAVVHARRWRGLSPGGVADPPLLSRLGVYRPACRIGVPLAPGDSSPSVQCLRQFLRGFGLVTATDRFDYDDVVTDHVRTLQTWRGGLPVNGIADELFLRSIAAWRPPPTVPTTSPANVTGELPPPTTAPIPTTTTTTTTTATTTSEPHPPTSEGVP